MGSNKEIGDRVIDGINKCFNQQMTHFFGVYDGHGGSQVKFNSVLYYDDSCVQ